MTDKDTLYKGVKYALGGIPMMLFGPAIIYNAFMNQHTWIHYIVLFVGIAISFGGAFFLFKGVMTILKSMKDS